MYDAAQAIVGSIVAIVIVTIGLGSFGFLELETVASVGVCAFLMFALVYFLDRH